jgi:predicted ester cyclase
MSAEENKALVRRYFDEVVNQRNYDLIREIFSTQEMNPVKIERNITELVEAFPDVKATIEDMVAEGDSVAVRWVNRGTHKGTWRGIAPTGKKVEMCGATIFRVKDGKIVSGLGEIDFMGVLKQLGVAPALVKSMPTEVAEAVNKFVNALIDQDHDGIPDLFERTFQVVDLEEPASLVTGADRLAEAREMFAKGLITKEEFEATKKQILSEM